MISRRTYAENPADKLGGNTLLPASGNMVCRTSWVLSKWRRGTRHMFMLGNHRPIPSIFFLIRQHQMYPIEEIWKRKKSKVRTRHLSRVSAVPTSYTSLPRQRPHSKCLPLIQAFPPRKLSKEPLQAETEIHSIQLRLEMTTAGSSATSDAAVPIDVTSPDQFTSIMEADLGRITLINFWASWAEPCKQMNQVVKDLATKFPHIAVLNVSSLSELELWCHQVVLA